MFGSIAGSLLRALAGVLTPDGRRLIVSNSDHAVRVWGEGASRVHVGHRGSGVRPSSLAWSAGGLLASADGSGRVQLWNPATGEPGKEHFVHQGGARAIAFPRSTAGSGGRWASAGLDGVRLWEGTSPLPDRVLPDPTTALAFAPSGELLAAGGQDGALRLLSLTGQPTLTLPAHSREVHAVAFSPDGSRLASSSADGSVLLWDPRTRRLVARLEGLEGEAKALAFSPDGLTLVSGSQGHALRLWSPDDGRPLGALQTANTGENLALAFAPLGAAPASGLLLASSLRGLHLWDVDRRAAQMELGGFHFLVGLAFSPDGRRAALLRDDGLLTLLQLDGVNQLGSPARDLEGLMKLYKYVADAGDLIRDEEELRPPAERK